MAAIGDGQFPFLTRELHRRVRVELSERSARRIEPIWMLLALAAFSWGLVAGVVSLMEWVISASG